MCGQRTKTQIYNVTFMNIEHEPDTTTKDFYSKREVIIEYGKWTRTTQERMEKTNWKHDHFVLEFTHRLCQMVTVSIDWKLCKHNKRMIKATSSNHQSVWSGVFYPLHFTEKAVVRLQIGSFDNDKNYYTDSQHYNACWFIVCARTRYKLNNVCRNRG